MKHLSKVFHTKYMKNRDAINSNIHGKIKVDVHDNLYRWSVGNCNALIFWKLFKIKVDK